MAANKAQMMPTFAYDGVDRKGIKIKGELPARNMALAKVTLRKQGITIKTIREKRNFNARYHHFCTSARHDDESGCTVGTKF